MKFITYGIHTRLHYLLKRINGIDEKMRINYLHELYEILKDVLDRIVLYDIENLVKSHTVDEVVSMLESEVRRKSTTLDGTLMDYVNILNRECYKSFGNYSRILHENYL